MLLPELQRLDPEASMELIINSSILKHALSEVFENVSDYAVKLKCTVLLIEIWFLFPQIVGQADSLKIRGHRN